MATIAQDARTGETFTSEATAADAAERLVWIDHRPRYVVCVAGEYRVLTPEQLRACTDAGETVLILRPAVERIARREPIATTAHAARASHARVTAYLAERRATGSPEMATTDGTPPELAPLPRVRASQRPAGWRDPSDVDPEIRDEYDALADDLHARD